MQIKREKLYFILVAILTFSCQEKIKEKPAESTKPEEPVDQVITYEEYSGPEPTKPEATEYYDPKVPVVKPGKMGSPPSDAIVLFDGTSLDGWISSQDSTAAKWHLNKDKSMTVNDKTGNIQTKQNFGDIQLHIEWRSPLPVQREGQNRGNSGIFLDGMYEIQVLDNNDNDTYVNGQVGTIYKQGPPLAMASVPTGDWNAYDIIYHEPKFNAAGEKIKSGTITVIQNGVVIQDHTEIKGNNPLYWLAQESGAWQGTVDAPGSRR